MSKVNQIELIAPRKTISFGGFTFVEPNLNYKPPIFSCCSSLKDPSCYQNEFDEEEEEDSFDKQEEEVVVAPPIVQKPPPVAFSSSSNYEKPTTSNYQERNSYDWNHQQSNQQHNSFDNDDDGDIFIEEINLGNSKEKSPSPGLDDSFENFQASSAEVVQGASDDANDSFEDFEPISVPTKSLATLQKSSSEVALNQQRHDMHGRFRGFLQDDSEEFNNELDLLGAEMNEELYSTLKSKFGFNQFRHRQKQCILSTLMGHDTFVLMPTGAGKSLCYQLPAVILPGVTVVVSPLRSLIEDQKMKMKELGIGCEALTADLSTGAQEDIYTELCSENPSIKLLYVTPEKVFSQFIQKSTKKNQ
ncbi:hypothetical protein B9Z55_013173 [Caenorhabditis nigoni]|uniref:Helicase ATP-binding domain-containing protein n=1 Tax=Caenorhabditis nigoni TaxID=1611254 RepID=A0A2G5U0G4_9PELO|nr:hypothetical protein B9Z55_013173 [Caenorhabditis nigoni]